MRAHSVTSSTTRDGEVLHRQHFCHHGDTICHPKSGCVTTKLHGTSTCGCNNNAIFSDRAVHVSYRRRIPATLIWPRQSIGGSFQSTEMATRLNFIPFVFKISFLPSIVSYRGRSGRIAHLTFIRIKNILNANPSTGNLPHGKLRYVYLV